MGRPRIQLHEILTAIPGVVAVYFQAPGAEKMQYPCIVYQRETADTQFADDIPYRKMNRYQVTVIDRNPDSEIPDNVAKLQLCTHARAFPANNLNHDVFTLYF